MDRNCRNFISKMRVFNFFLLIVSFCAAENEARKIYKEHQSTKVTRKENTEEWPCPSAEIIAPCECFLNGDSSNIEIVCKDITDISEIRRVFSNDFPIPNLSSILILVEDHDLWRNSSSVSIPKNIFYDKTAKEIWIGLKIKHVHDQAFENTAVHLERLLFSGPGLAGETLPLKEFPMYVLEQLPNLRTFIIQDSNLKDYTFQWETPQGNTRYLSNLFLPNLEYFELTAGQLETIPKMFTAPNLKELRLSSNPIVSIEPFAFEHLESLEILNLSGLGSSQLLTTLETDVLTLTSKNFTGLKMNNFGSLSVLHPSFITNLQSYTILDFLNDNIAHIPQETFGDIFNTLSQGSGHVIVGGNPILCDCDIKWIIEDPTILSAIDYPGWESKSINRPRCTDGTLLADIDLDVLNELCP